MSASAGDNVKTFVEMSAEHAFCFSRSMSLDDSEHKGLPAAGVPGATATSGRICIRSIAPLPRMPFKNLLSSESSESFPATGDILVDIFGRANAQVSDGGGPGSLTDS